MIAYRSYRSACAFTTFTCWGLMRILLLFFSSNGLGRHEDTPSEVLWNACTDLRLGKDQKAETALRLNLFVQ